MSSEIERIRQVRQLLVAHRASTVLASCSCGEDYGGDATHEDVLQSHDEHQARVIVAWSKLSW